jgi:predicted ATPase
MLTKMAVENYRSIRRLVIPLGRLNVIVGPNGSGKSNLYRALRLLASAADDGMVARLASEGGMASTTFAGPGSATRGMREGTQPVQGTARREPVRLRLGFAGTELGYSIALGYPPPGATAFAFDPEIKSEAIWAGEVWRNASTLVSRERGLLRVRQKKGWKVVSNRLEAFESVFSQPPDEESAPEVLHLRESIRRWRFYDHFRTDLDAPARRAQVGTLTPVLAHDGRDLAAAIQTILEIGDAAGLQQTVDDAFPGGRLNVAVNEDGRFALLFTQHGLLRALGAPELSDGTLRYFLLMAALLTPRPPALMVLDEPEASLHPDLLPALGRLIIRASRDSQMWIVTHSARLIAALEKDPDCNSIVLDKQLGATVLVGQRLLDEPSWHWPDD